MNFDTDCIKNKRPFFGSLNIKTSWDEEMQFLDSHPEKLIDTHPEKLRYYLKASHSRPSLSDWAKNVISGMEKTFYENDISLIKFLGFGQNTDSYPWHADKMDVFLVQAIGTPMISVEKTSSEKTPIKFPPGKCVYIPRGTHHWVQPQGSRVTYSFGVERQPDPCTYVGKHAS